MTKIVPLDAGSPVAESEIPPRRDGTKTSRLYINGMQ